MGENPASLSHKAAVRFRDRQREERGGGVGRLEGGGGGGGDKGQRVMENSHLFGWAELSAEPQ